MVEEYVYSSSVGHFFPVRQRIEELERIDEQILKPLQYPTLLQPGVSCSGGHLLA